VVEIRRQFAPYVGVSMTQRYGRTADLVRAAGEKVRDTQVVAGVADSSYRQYSENDVHTLRFILQARDLGFSIAEIGELVALWRNRRRPSRQVKAFAEAHIQELEQKGPGTALDEAALEHLVRCCHGDERPECPILESLLGGAAAANSSDVPAAPRLHGKVVAGRWKS
jgi:DNA-binding transcriptional MerR regulator